MFAHEVFHYLKTINSRLYTMALKLDMYKAYDKVDWGFFMYGTLENGVYFTMGAFDYAVYYDN